MLTTLSSIGFFARFWHQLIIIFLSCVPIIESRYAIVIGDVFFTELGTVELFILSQLGAFLVAVILLFLLRPVFNWMKSTRLFRKLVEKLENHGKKKGEKLEGKLKNSNSEKAKIWASVVGVFLFVAIPLPGTGVWTGSLVATLLNIRFKYAFPAICLGSIVATLIMLTFSSVFMHLPSWLTI
jgi:uncharacterized membrane protein